MNPSTIRKTLSPNDAGQTATHQAGILIPKDPRLLSFFPDLRADEPNPRAHILFEDPAAQRWEFAFIYYNNYLSGGTRNEYRLTRMTNYIRQAGLSAGDDVVLRRDEEDRYFITHEFAAAASSPAASDTSVLRLSGGWRIIIIST